MRGDRQLTASNSTLPQIGVRDGSLSLLRRAVPTLPKALRQLKKGSVHEEAATRDTEHEPKRGPAVKAPDEPKADTADAAVEPQSPPRPAEAVSETRLAPDPFTAVLPALAALGAIASIATINWAAQERTPDRSRSKRKASTALRDLETCCLGLLEIFRRFQRNPRLFAGEGAPASSPLKFGVHGPRVGPDAARLFHQLINDVASMLVLASQNAFDVMSAVEDGEIEAPEELFYGFGEQQDRLNQLIQSRATLKTSVDTGADVAARLTLLVRELKRCRPE